MRSSDETTRATEEFAPSDEDEFAPLVILPDDVDLEALVAGRDLDDDVGLDLDEDRDGADRRGSEVRDAKIASATGRSPAAESVAAPDGDASPPSGSEEDRRRRAEERERERAAREAERRAQAEAERAVDRELAAELALGDTGRLPFTLLLRAVACVTLALLAVLACIGWSYYSIPLAERPLHHLHRHLRPSGSVGLLLGIGGTVLMLASMSYLVRKRFAGRNPAALRKWLGFHILTGLLGPALVVFHAAFVPASAIGALAFSAMLVVVGSGVVGRYVLAYFPKTLEGDELELATIRRRLRVYREKLVEHGVSLDLLEESLPAPRPRSFAILRAAGGLLLGDRRARLELKRLRVSLEASARTADDTARNERVLLLVRRLARERQWNVRYRELRALIGAWRFAHRWLAVVLFAGAFYHVIVALRFGGLWLLGGHR